ncbi:hypothetical protein QYF36_026732 [Acer negundo]|nr:hypothetical protein QYF36_026732 [Acer negundo]
MWSPRWASDTRSKGEVERASLSFKKEEFYPSLQPIQVAHSQSQLRIHFHQPNLPLNKNGSNKAHLLRKTFPTTEEKIARIYNIKEYLTSEGVEWEESADLMDVASKCDIVYQNRIQREHFSERNDLYEEARGKYIIDRDVLRIAVDVDADPRAAYFRQAKNGLYIRMALLKLLLVGW